MTKHKLFKSLLLGLIALIFSQCNSNSTPNSQDDIWIGAYKDFGRKFPLSLMLDFSNQDSLVTYDSHARDTLVSSYYLKNDSIFINDTIQYKLRKSEKELVFGDAGKGARFYYPPKESQLPKGNVEEFQKRLMNTNWSRTIENKPTLHESLQIKEQYEFDTSRFTITRSYYLRDELITSEEESMSYHLSAYKNVVMILFYGNQNSSDAFKNAKIGQLVKLNNSSLEINYESSTEYSSLILSRTKDKMVKDAQPFYVCNGNRIFQYYNSTRTNSKGCYNDLGNDRILKAIQKDFETINNGKGENGYIRVRFVVNCDGQTGRWSVQECTRDYEPHVFPKELVQSVLKFTIDLDGWNPRDKINGNGFDDYKYLTYKIKDGEVVEIMP